MNVIGTFEKSGDEFVGEIITLSVQALNVRIAPVPGRGDANSPSHRVLVGRAMIGLAWPSVGGGAEVLSLKLDDPSFSSPIRASLVEMEDVFRLVWSR